MSKFVMVANRFGIFCRGCSYQSKVISGFNERDPKPPISMKKTWELQSKDPIPCTVLEHCLHSLQAKLPVVSRHLRKCRSWDQPRTQSR